MSVQHLIKYNLWERNSSSLSVPLCKQDLLFTSSAKSLSCDQKKKVPKLFTVLWTVPRLWSAREEVMGSLLYSRDVFTSSTWSVTQGRCAATARMGAAKAGTARALQTVLRCGEWDTWLLYPSLEAEVRPELWKYNLNQGRYNSSLHVPALWSSFRRGKKILQTAVTEE